MIETIHDTFLGIPPAELSFERSRVVLVRVPYEATTSYGAGARFGPAAIMAASTQVELLDLELNREPWTVGIHALPALAPTAAGPEAMTAQVEEICRGAHLAGKLVFCLGGEHSVTVGAARAAAARFSGLSFLQVDAHLDLRDRYEGSAFSHACTARRLLDIGRVVNVGARVACPEELEIVRSHGLDPVYAHELARLSEEEWISRAIDQLGPEVYVTVDVDGLDPTVMPATGTPVPGGLGWNQLLALLRAVGERRRVVACDVCELAPIPGLHAPEFAGALLVYKMIGYFTAS